MALASATLNLYASADCSGAPLATGSGAQFTSPGIPVTVADNSTTTFHAQATQNGSTSDCSATSVSYAEVTPPPVKPRDTKAPNTRLISGPRGRVRTRTVRFRFASTEKGSTFKCRLDRQKRFSRCRSPKTYRRLRPGRHVFRVVAIDGAGNVDRRPAVRVFRIERRRHRRS